MLILDNPWALVLFAVPAAAFILSRLPGRKKSLASFGFVPWPDGARIKAPAAWKWVRIATDIVHWAGFAWLVIAASDPRATHLTRVYSSRGNDIVFVIDLSPSMGAEDIEPSRFEAAKRIMNEFLSVERNESVGIVAFGKDASLVCPPTLDYDTVKRRIGDLKLGTMGDGTAIGTGLAIAVRHLVSSRGPGKYAVVFTDGENNAGVIDPLMSAALAAETGVDVSIIGLGTKGEVPITWTDPKTGSSYSGTFKSEYDESALSGLADTAGGRFKRAGDSEALSRVFDEIASESMSTAVSRMSVSSTPLADRFCYIGFALLALAFVLGRIFPGGRP